MSKQLVKPTKAAEMETSCTNTNEPLVAFLCVQKLAVNCDTERLRVS